MKKTKFFELRLISTLEAFCRRFLSGCELIWVYRGIWKKTKPLSLKKRENQTTIFLILPVTIQFCSPFLFLLSRDFNYQLFFITIQHIQSRKISAASTHTSSLHFKDTILILCLSLLMFIIILVDFSSS